MASACVPKPGSLPASRGYRACGRVVTDNENNVRHLTEGRICSRIAPSEPKPVLDRTP